jgi:hypothetical protein
MLIENTIDHPSGAEVFPLIEHWRKDGAGCLIAEPGAIERL